MESSSAAPRVEESEIQSERKKAMSCLAKAEDGQLELLTLLTSVDMICFTSPCLASGTKGVTLYHNKSTSDVPNERAMRLLDACGFASQLLCGWVFLSAEKEYIAEYDEKPSRIRCDFTLKDVGSDVSWVRELRERREQSGAKAEAEREWFDTYIPQPFEESEGDSLLAGGETATYVWRQTYSEVEISFRPQLLQAIHTTKRDIKVRFCVNSLLVQLRARVLLDLVLTAVDPSDCTWTFDPCTCELQLFLTKADARVWDSLGTDRQPEGPNPPLTASSTLNAGGPEVCSNRRRVEKTTKMEILSRSQPQAASASLPTLAQPPSSRALAPTLEGAPAQSQSDSHPQPNSRPHIHQHPPPQSERQLHPNPPPKPQPASQPQSQLRLEPNANVKPRPEVRPKTVPSLTAEDVHSRSKAPGRARRTRSRLLGRVSRPVAIVVFTCSVVLLRARLSANTPTGVSTGSCLRAAHRKQSWLLC